MRSYKPRDLVHILIKAGFVPYKSKGSHTYYKNFTTGKSTCVSMHPGDVARGTARGILIQAGLWEQERNR